MDSEPLAADANPENFSLVQGGPVYQLMLRAKLVMPTMELLRRRILAYLAIAWFPLVVLTLLDDTFVSGVKVPFLYDLTNVRDLISLPILIGAELIVHRRLRGVVQAFLERELIAPDDQPKFKAMIIRAMRLRNSVLAEGLLFLVSFTGGYWLWRTFATLRVSTWYASSVDGAIQLNAAGYWLAFISLPIGRFILIRWYFRLLIWYLFLWRVSRLRLRLNPLHPDRAGGLGFLEHTVTAFSPVLIAQSVFLAVMIGNQILHTGARLPDFKFEIASFVVILTLTVLLPLTFFVMQMVEAKLAAIRDYGQLASRYANDFQRKWFQVGKPPEEALLGTADIQSLADLSNSFEVVREMRPVPFDRNVVVRLVLVIVCPLLPLVLTMIPLDELLRNLLQLFL